MEQTWACQSSPIMYSGHSGLTIPRDVPSVPPFCYDERSYMGMYKLQKDMGRIQASITFEEFMKPMKQSYSNCEVFKKVFVNGDTTGGPYVWLT